MKATLWFLPPEEGGLQVLPESRYVGRLVYEVDPERSEDGPATAAYFEGEMADRTVAAYMETVLPTVPPFRAFVPPGNTFWLFDGSRHVATGVAEVEA